MGILDKINYAEVEEKVIRAGDCGVVHEGEID